MTCISVIFILWKGDEKEALLFVELINSNNWGIQLTPNFSSTQIEFLDLSITHDDKSFITSTFFKKVDANSYLDFSSGHFHKWKRNVPYGQFRRIRKNCTEDSTYYKQATVIRKRFAEKGYPRGLIKNAMVKAGSLTQAECLKAKPVENPQQWDKINFITTYNKSHKKIQNIFRRHWYILKKDLFLQNILPDQPHIVYRRPPTLKTMLAPSKLRRHKPNFNLTSKTKGAFKCGHKKCLCCLEVKDNTKVFSSTKTGESFPMKHHLTCQSSYVIYLLECCCTQQYVGRTLQNLNRCMNKHRANIRNKFLLHGVSRHCAFKHPENPHPISIIPIDVVSPNIQNRFEVLKKKEIFWIYKLKTLQPFGLNEISEIVEL